VVANVPAASDASISGIAITAWQPGRIAITAWQPGRLVESLVNIVVAPRQPEWLPKVTPTQANPVQPGEELPSWQQPRGTKYRAAPSNA